MTSTELAEITERFGLGDDPGVDGPPLRGEQGQVWRLRTTNGVWALKELILSQSEADMHASAEFQEAAHKVGVPAPAVVRTAQGTVLLDLDHRQFRVFTWADLLPADPGLDPAQVGVLLARMHALRHPSKGDVHPWYTEPVGAVRWHQLVSELIAGGFPLGQRLAALEDELCVVEDLLEAPSRLQTLHLDLWADNVRATPSGDLCVIDWDNCGTGDPTHELAAMLFEYGGGDASRVRTLYQSYVAADGPGRITSRGDFSMLIAQLGHILQMQCQNWLRATTEEGRSRAQMAIEEYVSRPVARRAIDEMLAAIN